jgi:D-amino peptidase
VLLVGYHAMAGTKKGVLDHTWSDTTVRALFLNGRLVGEIGLNAALAGEYQAPVIAFTGDQHAGAEAQDLLGPALEIAVVKNATGRYAAQCLPLAEARERICEAAARSVTKFRSGQAAATFRLVAPIRLEIEFMDTQQADRAFLIPGTERPSGTRVEFTAPDMVTAHRALRAMVMLAHD